jgi:hypothetical protein
MRFALGRMPAAVILPRIVILARQKQDREPLAVRRSSKPIGRISNDHFSLRTDFERLDCKPWDREPDAIRGTNRGSGATIAA